MIRYVVGFLHDGDRVALIQKNKPEWQAGRWNGIGGKIEPNESAIDAMTREFHEEAGVIVNNWRYLLRLKSNDVLIYFFTRKTAPILLNQVRTLTDETVRIHPADTLPDVISNLRWIIPLAMYDYDVYEPMLIKENNG